MALGIYNSNAFKNASGVQVVASANVEVRRESDSGLASIFSDRAGTAGITQVAYPGTTGFKADANGYFEFFAEGIDGGYQVRVYSDDLVFDKTVRYQATGTARERDASSYGASLMASADAAAARLVLAFAAIAAKGDLWVGSAADTIGKLAIGATNGLALIVDAAATLGMKWGVPVLRSYLAGCTLSTAGASATMSISAGIAADSTNVSMMSLAAIAKTTASWVVGTAAGGLDTGTIANNTWYAFYVIQRPDTGVVDVIFSLNGTTPALPANYTLYRRIGWGLTNGAAQWVKFKQDGSRFIWDVPVQDVNFAACTSANRTARTLTAAPSSEAIFSLAMNTGTVGVVTGYILLTTADMTDTAAGVTQHTISVTAANTGATSTTGTPEAVFKLNSSRQVFDRADSTSRTVAYFTRGWIDARGRDD